MHSKHKIIEYKNLLINHRKKYLLRIGSHRLYDSLKKIGLFPNKSLTIRLPSISQDYFSSFLRGYLDGDGCVYLEIKRESKTIKGLSVIFTSGSRLFLDDLRKSVNFYCKIDKLKVYISHRSFQLRYKTKDSLRILSLIYLNKGDNLYLKRKYQIYQKYLKFKNGHMVK